MRVQPLPGGHTLLHYTDGLIETRHDDIDDRLSALREHAATPAAGFCDAVLGSLPARRRHRADRRCRPLPPSSAARRHDHHALTVVDESAKATVDGS